MCSAYIKDYCFERVNVLAHLGLDCLTPNFPFGKKVTVAATTASDMIDEKTTKQAGTKGLAVAPVGFPITSQLAVKSTAQDLWRPWAGAACEGCCCGSPGMTKAKLLFSLKLKPFLGWTRSSPASKQRE